MECFLARRSIGAIKDRLKNVTKGHEKNDLGFLVVMSGGPMP